MEEETTVKKKVGRPKGSKTKKRKVVKKTEPAPVMFRCVHCGKEWQDRDAHFYMSAYSEVFEGNDKRVHICSGCINEMYTRLVKVYKDERFALLNICAMLDWYFSDKIYEDQKNNPKLSPGIYARFLNNQQYRTSDGGGRTFRNTLIEITQRGGLKETKDTRDEIEEGWSENDLKAKRHVLSVVGYDCFNDTSYDSRERKFLFNTMSQYCSDEIADDPHKLTQTIIMIKSMLQIEKLDKMINEQIKYQIDDSTKMKEMMSDKSILIKSINSIAADNGISERTAKGQRKASTLTAIMREMEERGFEEIKVNTVEAKMSASYREIAEANAKALMAELNLTSDDYAEMVAKQSDMIRELQQKLEQSEERNRKLYVKLKESGVDDVDGD